LTDADRAASAWPNDLGVLQLLLKIQSRLGLKERAAQTQALRDAALKRVALMDQLGEDLVHHPDDPHVPWKIGRTAEESGSFLLASRCYQAALALGPNFAPARESLAALRAAHPELAARASQAPSLSSAAGLAHEPPRSP
jgi:hypothetical protein